MEASTGNTALALALIAKQKGYKLKVVIPHRATPGVADLLASYDVEIVCVRPSCRYERGNRAGETAGT